MSGQPGTKGHMAQRPARWAPGLPALWAWAVLAGLWIVLNLTLIRPHDFWWHVATGQWIVEHGRVPGVDLYSFTRLGEPYAYGLWWLSQVAFYLLLRAGDLPMILLAHALTITIAYGVLLRTSLRAAGGDLRWSSAAVLAAAAAGLDNWNVRPQTASILFFSLTLHLLERHRAVSGPGRRGGAIWALIPLFALWANAHPGFLLGLALVGAHVAAGGLDWLRKRGEFPRREALVAVLCCLATFLTPLGPDTLTSAAALARHPTVRRLILEWQPPAMADPSGLLFFGVAAALMALLLVSRRLGTHEAIRLLLFGLMALAARRNVIWFGFVAAPTMAACLAAWAQDRRLPARATRGRPLLNLGLAAAVGVLAALSLPWLRPHLPLPAQRRAYLSAETPVEALNYLRNLAPGPGVFHSEGYGAYMIWASPDIPVFIDPRFELYPAEQWQDSIAVSDARYDWEAILARYGVDTLFLDRERMSQLAEAAAASGRWEQAYQDDRSVIFRRRGGP